MGFLSSIGNFFTGTPERYERRSRLRPSQEPLAEQSIRAGLQPGAGGAFGESADYYRDLLSNDSKTNQMMAAPEMRRFNEEIIPGLAEQFAGMGSGALSSSGFRNASVNAGTDLSERLGAIRAQLRQQGAQGLQGIGQQGLSQYDENIFRPGTQGLADYIGPAIGSFGSAVGGPVLGALGGAAGNLTSNWLSQSKKGKSSPYGGTPGGPGLYAGGR